MSFKCKDIIVSNVSAAQKQRAKQVAKTYRYGSPKIRDVLRERCRQRMRDSRLSSFETSRSLVERFNLILHEELSQLEEDIELQELIMKELADEVNDWLIEQQEAEESYMISFADDENNKLLCPVCQAHLLEGEKVQNKFVYACECSAKFTAPWEETHLRTVLSAKIDLHEENCPKALCFYVEPVPDDAEQSMLSTLCKTCDFFYSFNV